MPLWKVALLSFAALITMVNPLAVVPSFIALTEHFPRPTRASVAFAAGVACIIVLAVFFIAGNYLFNFFGITVPAFQIMGGILFLTTALRSLVVEDRRAPGEKRMIDEDVEKADVDPNSIAIVPLAVPMLSGPGAITSVMVLVNLYPKFNQKLAVLVAIAAVGAVSWTAAAWGDCPAVEKPYSSSTSGVAARARTAANVSALAPIEASPGEG